MIRFIVLVFLIGNISATALMAQQDTFYIMKDIFPEEIDLQKSGEINIWDYTSLTSPYAIEKIFIPGDPSDPNNATDKIKTSNYFIQNVQLDKGDLYLISQQNVNPYIKDRVASINYTDPYPMWKQSLELGESEEYSNTIKMVFAAEKLPDEIWQYIPPSTKYLRLIIDLQGQIETDATGQIYTPGGFYNVNRQRKLEFRTINYELLKASGDWEDVTNQVKGLFPTTDQLSELHFLTPELRVPVVSVFLENEQQINTVEYGSINKPNIYINKDLSKKDIFIYPNPSYGDVRLNILNYPNGTYKIKVFNILGSVIWDKDIDLDTDKSFKLDLTHLKKGSYFYSLEDAKGNTLKSKKLVIIRS